jgi:hypothetical protein
MRIVVCFTVDGHGLRRELEVCGVRRPTRSHPQGVTNRNVLTERRMGFSGPASCLLGLRQR